METACVREIRATPYSVGGAILIALCVLLTIVTFLIATTAAVTSIQHAIFVLLTIASWLYFISSVTERLRLVEHGVEYASLFSPRKHVSLDRLEKVLLIHQGFNVEKGIETIEFRRQGMASERITLGPCWQRHQLEVFLHAIEDALHDARLLEEVR